MIFAILGLIVLGVVLFLGTCIVPQQEVWIVQRLGKFQRKLEPGLNWVMPLAEVVAYRHSLKEESFFVPEQTAITQDNVSVVLDGIVYVKIFDPIAASYGVKDPFSTVVQLVQTTMRSEIGTLPLDKTFEERETLNRKIVEAINSAAISWGIQCLRYEIKDIKMPDEIRKAMELQMTAERQKRARILESEGVRQAQINESEGTRQSQINIAEAGEIDRVKRAKGEAEAIEVISMATAHGIERVAAALQSVGGEKAASLQIAEKYLEAFGKIAKEGSTILLPSNLQDPAAMVSSALSIYDHLKKKSLSDLSLKS